jgi:hypothetical protein
MKASKRHRFRSNAKTGSFRIRLSDVSVGGRSQGQARQARGRVWSGAMHRTLGITAAEKCQPAWRCSAPWHGQHVFLARGPRTDRVSRSRLRGSLRRGGPPDHRRSGSFFVSQKLDFLASLLSPDYLGDIPPSVVYGHFVESPEKNSRRRVSFSSRTLSARNFLSRPFPFGWSIGGIAQANVQYHTRSAFISTKKF